MSDQTMTVQSEVRAYIDEIRAALSDLPAEDVDDLTQGMEADLLDVAREPGGSLRDRLGEPEAYAAELRSAAGLAPRVVDVRTPALGAALNRIRQAPDKALERWPWLRDLEPVWWLARGAVAAWVLCWILFQDQSVLLWMAGAALSFWAAKANPTWGPLSRRILTVVNVGAALLFLPAFGWAVSRLSSGPVDYYQPTFAPQYPPGIWSGDHNISNLYGYDDKGNRIERIRLFDQDGQPVQVLGDHVPVVSGGQSTEATFGTIEVFPHKSGEYDGWNGFLIPDQGPAWKPPVLIAPLLPEPPATTPPGPTPTPSATKAVAPQSSSPAPSLTPASTPTPTSAQPSPAPTGTTR